MSNFRILLVSCYSNLLKSRQNDFLGEIRIEKPTEYNSKLKAQNSLLHVLYQKHSTLFLQTTL